MPYMTDRFRYAPWGNGWRSVAPPRAPVFVSARHKWYPRRNPRRENGARTPIMVRSVGSERTYRPNLLDPGSGIPYMGRVQMFIGSTETPWPVPCTPTGPPLPCAAGSSLFSFFRRPNFSSPGIDLFLKKFQYLQ